MAEIEFTDVQKVYDDGTQAVFDLNLAINDGELMVLVGPSGCGKTTALRMVAGLEEISGGDLLIGDRVVNDLTPKERNIAMVFQSYALYPHMTVEDNLAFSLKLHKMPKKEINERVRRAARILQIEEYLKRKPRALSGGQRQRVAMGRALVREPSVFLLDEPLSNLDAKLRVQVRAEIKELQTRTRTTMIYVTHDQVEAMTLGERVAVLDRGRLQQVAPPGERYDRPANAFVAGFIGNPPMNLFPARVEVDGGGVVLRVGGGTVRIAAPDVPPDRARSGQITAGVRPESIEIVSSGPAAGDVTATVEHVENLGHETLAHLSVGGDIRLVARVEGMPGFAKGGTVAVRFDPARVYLFGEDGRSLART